MPKDIFDAKEFILEELFLVLRCSLADLEGSLQCYEKCIYHHHDWKAHKQTIDEVRDALSTINDLRTGQL